MVILTQYQGKILGPITKYILGPIINVIFKFLDWVFGSFDSGLVGLTIIVFTLVIYICLLPLTIKQQKFSKLSSIMNPELQAVQAKYKDRKDQESMMAMNAETKAIYAKYGVSPSGSCVQLLIQMPIMLALYRVIYQLPSYITTLKEHFTTLANYVISNNLVDAVKGLDSSKMYLSNFDIEGNTVNAVIDCLNVMNADTFNSYFGSIESCSGAFEKINAYNHFLGMHLANSPIEVIKQAWSAPSGIQWGLIIAAALVPIFAGVTQWLNVKLMPQANNNANNNQSDTAASMQQSMKLMNNIMPIMSMVFCFTFSYGIGIYWIAGSVIRSIQQIIVNKWIDKMDINELIKKNEAKRRKKLEKKGIDPDKVDRFARMNTKSIPSAASAPKPKKSMSDKASVKAVSEKEKNAAMEEAIAQSDSSTKKYKPGSLAEKAHMVSQYNNRDN